MDEEEARQRRGDAVHPELLLRKTEPRPSRLYREELQQGLGWSNNEQNSWLSDYNNDDNDEDDDTDVDDDDVIDDDDDDDDGDDDDECFLSLYPSYAIAYFCLLSVNYTIMFASPHDFGS